MKIISTTPLTSYMMYILLPPSVGDERLLRTLSMQQLRDCVIHKTSGEPDYVTTLYGWTETTDGEFPREPLVLNEEEKLIFDHVRTSKIHGRHSTWVPNSHSKLGTNVRNVKYEIYGESVYFTRKDKCDDLTIKAVDNWIRSVVCVQIENSPCLFIPSSLDEGGLLNFRPRDVKFALDFLRAKDVMDS